MYATVRLPILLSVVALAVASPYYLPQQRQLFYPVLPQYQVPYTSQYHGPLAPLPYRQFYYPQSTANLVTPVHALRYPSPVVHPSKQVVYYPGMPYPMVISNDGESEAEGGSTWGSWFNGWSNYFPGFGPSESPAEEGASPAESPATGAASPEGQKGQNSEKPAKEGEKEKEDEDNKPAEENKVKTVPQTFPGFNQPQFFGNFGFQRLNPAMVLPSANNGAVSSYLLLKNIPGVRFAAPLPQVPQVPQGSDAAPNTPEEKPGQAALDYQQLLKDAQADRQQKDFDDSSVTVDAAQKDATAEDADAEKPAAETESEDNKESEDEETGTNV